MKTNNGTMTVTELLIATGMAGNKHDAINMLNTGAVSITITIGKRRETKTTITN